MTMNLDITSTVSTLKEIERVLEEVAIPPEKLVSVLDGLKRAHREPVDIIANARKKSTAKPRRVPWGCDENCQGNIYVSSNQTNYVGHCGRCNQQYERKN